MIFYVKRDGMLCFRKLGGESLSILEFRSKIPIQTRHYTSIQICTEVLKIENEARI